MWGDNDSGQLGLADVEEQQKTPRRLNYSERFASIACGYYHTALVTGDLRIHPL